MNYLDCGCCFTDEGTRTWCPTCAAGSPSKGMPKHDMTGKTLDELRQYKTDGHFMSELIAAFDEVCSRLEEAQQALEQSDEIRSDMGYLILQLQQQLGVPTEPHQTYDERMLSALSAHDAEVAAKALEEILDGADDADCLSPSWMRDKAAEYRAKAGRKG